jgi:hypothetical protein
MEERSRKLTPPVSPAIDEECRLSDCGRSDIRLMVEIEEKRGQREK